MISPPNSTKNPESARELLPAQVRPTNGENWIIFNVHQGASTPTAKSDRFRKADQSACESTRKKGDVHTSKLMTPRRIRSVEQLPPQHQKTQSQEKHPSGSNGSRSELQRNHSEVKNRRTSLFLPSAGGLLTCRQVPLIEGDGRHPRFSSWQSRTHGIWELKRNSSRPRERATRRRAKHETAPPGGSGGDGGREPRKTGK